MTQRQSAEALGREQNFVARVETGQRRLDLIELIQVCRACGVDPDKHIPQLSRRIGELVPRTRADRTSSRR